MEERGDVDFLREGYLVRAAFDANFAASAAPPDANFPSTEKIRSKISVGGPPSSSKNEVDADFDANFAADAATPDANFTSTEKFRYKITVGGPPSSSKYVVLCEGEPCPPPRAPPSGTARR